MSRIGIVTGMPFERDLVRKAARDLAWGDAAPLVEASGVGGGDAASITRDMAEAGVAGIVSLGVAGGLSPAIRTGVLIVPDVVLAVDGRRWETAPEWRGQLMKYLTSSSELAGGAIVSTPKLVSTCDEKVDLREQSGAAAVDMESAGIAAAADAASLPFVVLRAISDPADQGLPPAVAAGLEDGEVKAGRLALAIAKRPGQILDLIRLGLSTRAARRALAGACRSAGPMLAFSRPMGQSD
ncbi:MAG: hypothetical protein AAF441_02990 [Pseudomonadota bacterium]